MRKINAKEIKKMIRLLVIILLVVLTIFLVIYNNPTDRKLRYIYNEKKAGEIGQMPYEVVHLFTTYRGRVPQRSVYKALYYFVDELVEKYYLNLKNANDSEIKGYYAKNTNEIKKELGLTQETDFISFIRTIQKLNSDELDLEEYMVNPNANIIQDSNDGAKLVLLVKYKNNERIGFNIEILNMVNTKMSPIIYKGDVTEENLEYEYEKYETPANFETTGTVIE